MQQKVFHPAQTEAPCLEPLYIILKVDLQHKKYDCVYSQDHAIYEEVEKTRSYDTFINRYVTKYVYEPDQRKVKQLLSSESLREKMPGRCMERQFFYRRVDAHLFHPYVWVKAIKHIDEREHTVMITLHQEQSVYPSDFKGQVVKTIGDKTYILIGNEEQLRAIGSGKTVYGAVYQAVYKGVSWKIDTDGKGNSILLYGGDADLKQEQNGKQDFTFGTILEKDSKLSAEGIHRRGRCGVNQNTGKIDPDLDIDKMTGQTYSANANYIIFRDIDLGSSNWTPLTFQGTMIGAKSAEKGGLWKDGVLNTTDKPVLSNVNVIQTGPLDVGKQMGVGFFDTLSDEASDNDVGLSKDLVKVSNLRFNNIKVDNQSTTTKYDQTLVNGLVSSLGKLLGGVVDLLAWLLTFGSVDAGLRKTLTDVLDARKNDPTALATGAIAGRVVGNVEISDCELIGDVIVQSPNNDTGGFTGYVTGKTEYEGLSKALGGTTKLLAEILNVIPGLGLWK